MEKKLTVFTPTYNRAYTLHKTYESLKKQNKDKFLWLIIDDGSTDNTKELVEKWIAEEIIEIKYYYQDNQGMHGAHNTAYELIDTELNVCIDSDDAIAEGSVDKIIEFWEVNKRDDIAGIAGLDIYEDKSIIGTKFPVDLKESTLFDLYHKYNVQGDKKLVYRTDLTKQYPYPIFEGEKYVGLAYKYNKIDLTHKLLLINEAFCIVEYMEDGSSRNMLNQYMKNPKGFAFYRKENMKNPKGSILYKFKESVHYVSSSKISKNKRYLKESPCKILTFLAIPLGIALSGYIIRKADGNNVSLSKAN